MLPQRVTLYICSGVVVTVAILATWITWRYKKTKFFITRPLYQYVAKKIFIVNSPEEWEASYMQLKKDIANIKVLGLDCEWVLKHDVALLQLASPSGLCILVRLFKFKRIFPESLLCLLADNSILKVGVAVVDDGKRLHQDYGFSVHGCVDLRHVLKRVRGTFHCSSKGLRGLANGVLGVDISKNIGIRCGNWEADIYSEQQVEYAATDAAVAVDIFLSLVFTKMGAHVESDQAFKSSRQKKSDHTQLSYTPSSLSQIQNRPSLTNPTILKVGDSSNSEQLLSNVMKFERSDNFCDVSFTHDLNEKGKNNDIVTISKKSVKSYLCSQNIDKGSNIFPSQICDSLQDDEKDEIYMFARSMCQGIVDSSHVNQTQGDGMLKRPVSRQVEKTKNNAYSFRKRPLWDNCRLQAPDGSLLCTCDSRKAQWYLYKELGDTVCEDPLTVRLRFEPSNRPDSERNYYLQEKKNICVVCGCDRDYIRKFIVPFEYRKYFPSALKDHSSHDVLLLCIHCHRKSCDSDIELRLRLAEECSAPLDSGTTSRIFLDHELQKVRSAGRALLIKNNAIPKERVVELEKILQDFYGFEKITEELIQQAATINAKQTADTYIPHGQKVVRHLISNGGLLAFQTRWRQHFLDTMNPQYLPEFWSVNFVPEAWHHTEAL